MKILVDMNLSPDWCAVLAAHGHTASHWSRVGNPAAPDREIMDWASANGFIVFTHDLDFSAILAATQAVGPSVLQVRTQDPVPPRMASLVVAALSQLEAALASGAVVVIDENRTRVRILPLRR